MLKNVITLTAAAALLCACTPRPTAKGLEAECDAIYKTFDKWFPCVKEKFKAAYKKYNQEDEDKALLYYATGETLLEKYNKKEISDAEARLKLLELRLRLKDSGGSSSPSAPYVNTLENYKGAQPTYTTPSTTTKCVRNLQGYSCTTQ